MLTYKDKRKFGWNKHPKNRNCKKFNSILKKERRRQFRRAVGDIKAKIIHRIPIDLYSTRESVINTAFKELGYDFYIYWSYFDKAYVGGKHLSTTSIITNIYDFI